jgi:imidazolonepropionase-like amidohydrolase
MKRAVLRATLAASLLTSTAGMAAQEAAAPGGTLTVRAGRVLDVKTGQYRTDQIILIEGQRIQEIGDAAQIEPHVPKGAQLIDLGKVTVLPGLIDCHTHLTMSPYLGAYRALSLSVPREALLGAHNARLTLEAGFTTVRNVGARGFADVALRDAINAGDVPGPRMLVSGPPLSITGGHADINLLAPEFEASADGVADSVPAVIAKVRRDIKYGADLIKFMASGGVLSKGDNPALEQYSPEEMRAIITTAHGLGRKVAAHAHGAIAIRDAAEAGVDSIEHGSFIDEDGIRAMKEHGTYLVPTLYLMDWFMENYPKMGLTEDMIEKAKVVMPAARRNVARAFREGVKVAFGTDAAVYPHGLNAHEFPVMVKLGLTPLQAIQAATVNAADLLGWQDRVGTLEPGKFADLIAVEGDPLADPSVLENVKFVMKGGVIYKNQTTR